MAYASEYTKIAAGKKALASYHNQMVEWYGKKYNLSYALLEQEVTRSNSLFFSQLGEAVISAKIGLRRLDEAMERVVEVTPTAPLKIPKVMGFIDGVTQEITEFDFSLLGDAGLDLAQVVVKKTQKIGEALDDTVSGVTNTFSLAGKILPLVLLSVVGIVLFAGFKIAKNTKKVSDVTPKVI